MLHLYSTIKISLSLSHIFGVQGGIRKGEVIIGSWKSKKDILSGDKMKCLVEMDGQTLETHANQLNKKRRK